MPWEQSVNTKTQEELDASAQSARDHVIEQYRLTLEDLENQIKKGRATLIALEKDTNKIHAAREEGYQEKEQALKTQKDQLDNLSALLHEEAEKLKQEAEQVSIDTANENQRVASNDARLNAREDQLNSLAKELDERNEQLEHCAGNQKAMALILSELKDNLEAKQKLLDEEKVALDQSKEDHNKAIEAHNENVQAHSEAVLEFGEAQEKNNKFYIATLAKEKEAEELKKKYEDLLVTIQSQDKRLRDEEIRVFKLSNDADKLLTTARQAEQKAKEEVEKLEALKQDLHTKIKEK